MKKAFLILFLVLVAFSSQGCLWTKTIYVPFPLPPTLIKSPIEPYLLGEDNDALKQYALECREQVRLCDSRMTIIREMQPE